MWCIKIIEQESILVAKPDALKFMGKLHSQERVYAVLGQYIVAFQSLEHELVNVLACLCNESNPQIGFIISSKLTFNTLLDLLDSIFRLKVKDSNLTTEFGYIINQSATFQRERNEYVHSYYDPSYWDGVNISLQRYKKKLRRGKGHSHSINDIDPNEIIVMVQNIYGLIVKIIDFCSKLQKAGYISDVYSQLT